MRKLLNNGLLSYSYLFILLLATVVPLNSISTTLNDNYTLHIRWDYLLHALVYLPLPFLLSQLVNHKPLLWIRIAVIGLLIAVCLESLQLVIPYRRFNINDMLANGLGVILGLIIVPLIRKAFPRLAKASTV